jgi:hypothetical protein
MAVRPPSSTKAFAVIQEIIKRGEIEIPVQFNGNGAPGNALEYFLNLTQNNNDSPDLMDWEIKFHGGNALLTLFHKEPSPRGIMDAMVNTFGWQDDKGRISFRHTLKGSSERGFIVGNAAHKITVTNTHDPSVVPYWDHNTILNAMGAKLRRLILVHGKVDASKRKVEYQSATAYWDLDLMGICKAIEDGVIYIDFDARTKLGRGTALRNHGTKFRIHINDIGRIYMNSEEISLV